MSKKTISTEDRLNQLEQELNALNAAYTPKSEAELTEVANRRYQSEYDQKRLEAQNAYETEDAALLRELSDLMKSYDSEVEASDAAYQSAYAQTGRDAVGRGMQRSSYLSQTLSGILTAGNEARQAIETRRTEDTEQNAAQRTTLASQYQKQINQYNSSQRSDTLSYLDTLTREEETKALENASTRSTLAMKLYEYRVQLAQEAEEKRRWQAEFSAKYGA